MLQKLKYILYALSFVLTASLSVSAPLASASSNVTEFACKDGTQDLKIAAPNSKHQVVVTCKSGQPILYENYNGIQPTAVKVTCPGTESGTFSAEKTNQANPKLTFYCVNAAQSDQQVGHETPSNHAPTVKQAKAVDVRCKDGSDAPEGDVRNCDTGSTFQSDCTISNCTVKTNNSGDCTSTTVSGCALIRNYIKPFINFLVALVAIAVVISIIIGGVQYSQSAGDPAKVSAAKNRIRNAIIALVTFLFLYAMLNFLLPGGLH